MVPASMESQLKESRGFLQSCEKLALAVFRNRHLSLEEEIRSESREMKLASRPRHCSTLTLTCQRRRVSTVDVAAVAAELQLGPDPSPVAATLTQQSAGCLF